jgi:hypothetical protein
LSATKEPSPVRMRSLQRLTSSSQNYKAALDRKRMERALRVSEWVQIIRSALQSSIQLIFRHGAHSKPDADVAVRTKDFT